MTEAGQADRIVVLVNESPTALDVNTFTKVGLAVGRGSNFLQLGGLSAMASSSEILGTSQARLLSFVGDRFHYFVAPRRWCRSSTAYVTLSPSTEGRRVWGEGLRSRWNQALRHPSNCLECQVFLGGSVDLRVPTSLILHHGVEDQQQLTHAGGEGYFGGLTRRN